MRRQFSFGTVFRMTDKSLLGLFFTEFGAAAESVPWDKLKRNDVDVLLKLFDELPSDKRNEAEVVLRQVHALSCELGIQSLGEAASELEPDTAWNNIYQSDQNLYTKVMSAWLGYREIFEYAVRFFEIDSLSWWCKRIDLPKIELTFDNDTKENLETELEQFFRNKQGRGFVCTVEMFARSNGTYYFYAYPDDYVEDALLHNETGELVPQAIRKTFELVFVYDSVEGTSDLCAKLPKKLKEELEMIFLHRLLGFLPHDIEPQPYDLSPLLDSSFCMRTRPEDNLRVQLTSLTLLWSGNAEFVAVSKNSLSASELSRQGINLHKFPLVEATVTKARFRFEFLSAAKGRTKSITFDVKTPDACTLKNQQPDYQELIHYYLKQWGIENEDNETTIADETLQYNPVQVTF